MAGIQLTEQRRSQLLEQLLRQQNQQRPKIQSGAELAARLLAQGIRQKDIKELKEQEAEEQKKLILALQEGQATGGKSVTLEDFEGGSGRQQIFIPGKRADPDAQQAALSKLPIEQQILAAQLQGLKGKDKPDEFTLSPGQARFRGRREVASVPANQPKRTKASFIDAETGDAHAGSFDGEFYRTSAGKVIRNASPIAPAAGQKDLQNNRQAFRPVEAATATSLGEIDNLIEQITASPNPETLVSVLGLATRGISSMANQARAAAAIFSGVKAGQSLKAVVNGETVNETALFDASLYDFGNAASESAAVKSNILNLAYAVMRANDPGGRLSDRDVQTGIDIITGPDVAQTIAKLKETRRRTVNTFRNDAISRDLQGQLDSFEQRFGISLDAANEVSPENDTRLKNLGL